MASFFQRIFSRVFIVLQRQPDDNENEDEDEKSSEGDAASKQNIESDVTTSSGVVSPKSEEETDLTSVANNNCQQNSANVALQSTKKKSEV